MTFRRNKFNNKKTTLDGITFDSAKEAKRFFELKVLERLGDIRNLELQPKFPFVVDGVKLGFYRADFGYYANNKRVIEDVKSTPTKTPVYRLKIKLLKALYPGIDHREV